MQGRRNSDNTFISPLTHIQKCHKHAGTNGVLQRGMFMQEQMGCLKGVHEGTNGMFGGVPVDSEMPTCRNAPNCALQLHAIGKCWKMQRICTPMFHYHTDICGCRSRAVNMAFARGLSPLSTPSLLYYVCASLLCFG